MYFSLQRANCPATTLKQRANDNPIEMGISSAGAILRNYFIPM
tara:strand:- start:57 stop:185 length:129 start_codon:yes stop_codon:yes gene_type:complete